MALIGTMKYLTIGDQTYEIAITETDPVFSASAAAGITATDISNWNAKVSDDKTWNGVTLHTGRIDTNSNLWIPAKSDSGLSGTAYWINTTEEIPNNVYSVNIPRYKKIDGVPYLQSSTPSANDNSTKVATTAYVDAAIVALTSDIPEVYSSTNTGGYLTMATLPIYDGTVI